MINLLKIERLKFVKVIRLKAFLLSTIILFVLFTLDWTIKYFIFDVENARSDNPLLNTEWIQHEHGSIGTRSFAHHNTTFLSFLKVDLSLMMHNVITMSLLFVFIFVPLFTRSMFRGVAYGFIAAGIAGNGIDRIMFGYVRDILYTPWADRGTFNIADICTIVGASLVVLSLIWDLFIKKTAPMESLK